MDIGSDTAYSCLLHGNLYIYCREAGTAENNKKMITEITGLIKVFKSYKGAETPEAKSTLADISTKFSELSNTQTDFLEAESFLPNKFNQISVVEDLLKVPWLIFIVVPLWTDVRRYSQI